MMGFILSEIFTKIVSQVVIIKKIVILKTDCGYWKGLWLLKKNVIIEKIVIIEKDHDYWKRLWLLKMINSVRWDKLW